MWNKCNSEKSSQKMAEVAGNVHKKTKRAHRKKIKTVEPKGTVTLS